MKNKDFVINVIKKCEEIHPNLYHSVEKEKVESFINSVNWDCLSEVGFDFNMLKLFAMFKDAHTGYNNNIPYESMGIDLRFVCGKIYLRHNNELLPVQAINGYSAEEVLEKMSQLLNFETDSRKNHMLSSELCNGYYYKMLGIASDKVAFSVLNENGKVTVVESEIKSSHQEREEKSSEVKRQKTPQVPYYEYFIVNDNILRLNYRSCNDMQHYPFKQFLEEMKTELQDKNIEGVVVDLRGNGGGRSSIIVPFVRYVKEKGWPCVVLMDNGTFSSGVMAVRDFKKECEAVLIGEDAGQGTINYGDCPPFEMNGKSINCCTKYFDFSADFGYKGVVKPDIYVQRTIEEIRTGQQTQQVRTAYEIINKMIEERRNEQIKIIE